MDLLESGNTGQGLGIHYFKVVLSSSMLTSVIMIKMPKLNDIIQICVAVGPVAIIGSLSACSYGMLNPCHRPTSAVPNRRSRVIPRRIFSMVQRIFVGLSLGARCASGSPSPVPSPNMYTEVPSPVPSPNMYTEVSSFSDLSNAVVSDADIWVMGNITFSGVITISGKTNVKISSTRSTGAVMSSDRSFTNDYGGMFQIEGVSDVTFTGLNFTSGSASRGGCIYVEGSSTVKVEDVHFETCYAVRCSPRGH